MLNGLILAAGVTLAAAGSGVGPYVEQFFPEYLSGSYETNVVPYGAACNQTGLIEERLTADYDERLVSTVAFDETGSTVSLYVSGDRTTYTVLGVASANPGVTCALEAGILQPGEGI